MWAYVAVVPTIAMCIAQQAVVLPITAECEPLSGVLAMPALFSCTCTCGMHSVVSGLYIMLTVMLIRQHINTTNDIYMDSAA